MAGFVIGAVLSVFGAADRYLGHGLSADIEGAIGLLCMSIQFGVNGIVRAIRK